ncbi:hypothetical protein V3N99_07390 [Dermatophilaceae bacterium Soc4.6]
MPTSNRRPALAITVAMSCWLVAQTVLANPAAAVSASRSALVGGELRLEGHSFPGVYVIARSTTSSAGARADQSGSYRITASGFTAPDCTVTISDGDRTATATATLSGCTPSAVAVPPNPAAPTGSCLITPKPATTIPAGSSAAVFFETTGCDTTTGSGATPTPVQWKVVAGSIPTGMTGPFTQGTSASDIIGTPSRAGTYRFTLEVIDQVKATDQENFTVTVG